MDDINSFEELFQNYSFKGSNFYFYCPNMNEEDKILIINLIKEKGGVRIYRII